MTSIRALHRHPRAGFLALLGAGALLIALLPSPSVASAANDSSSELSPPAIAVTYPTAARPAAAQPEEWFDLDVQAPSAGTLEAEIRESSRSKHGWIPLDVASEIPDQQVPSGDSTLIAAAPADTKAGTYILRVRILDAEGKAIAEEKVHDSVAIENHSLPTGFELSDAQEWTSFTQEQDFLAQLADKSPRTTLTTLGESVNGLPYNMLAIGAGASASAPDVDGDAVLLVCSQHGNEPSGREACLQHARKLAFSTDSRIQDYLRKNTVLVIPSANPDGSAANTRENANGVDINRDHLRLEEPETRMIATVMRDTRPETVHDLHEMSGEDRPHLETVWGRHPQIDDAVRQYGVDWGNEAVRPRVEAAGYRTGPYMANPGEGENTTLTNGAMLRNLNGVISETNRSVLTAEGEDPVSARNRRVDTQNISIHETLRQHRTTSDDMAETQDEARGRNVELGYTQQGPYFFYGNSESPEPPPRDSFIMDVPCGYSLSESQAQDRAVWMDFFDVFAHPQADGNGAFVPMWQESSSVIPLMFDGRARSNEINAEQVYDCSG